MVSTSGYAIASFVLGILSIFIGWIPLIGWSLITLAIIFGIVGLIKIKNENLGGTGLAITGIILGFISIVIMILIIFNAMMGAISWSSKVLPEVMPIIDTYNAWYTEAHNLSDCYNNTKFKTQNDRETCFAKIAKKTRNFSVCNMISDDYRRVTCYTISIDNSENCDLINDSRIDICYENTGIIESNISICDKIQTDLRRKECYLQIAMKSNDKNICDSFFNDTSFKNRCNLHFGMTEGSLENCDKMNNGEGDDFCYLHVVRIIKDESICNKIKDITFKNNCYHIIAVVKKDMIFCEKIDDSNFIEELTKDYCFMDVAVLNLDISICEKMKHSMNKNECKRILQNQELIDNYKTKAEVDV